MPIQEHLHGFLLELFRVCTPRSACLSLRRMGHWIVLPLPCRIRSWTVQKNPSTSPRVNGVRTTGGIVLVCLGEVFTYADIHSVGDHGYAGAVAGVGVPKPANWLL